MAGNGSVSASWDIGLPEGEFLIEFEHGTTSGKRILRINGQEIVRRDWMFRLVGCEMFRLGRFQCRIDVEPDGFMGLVYTLQVDGNPIEQFLEMAKKNSITWTIQLNGNRHRIVLEKDKMDVWLDGKKVYVEVHFVEGGIEMSFPVDEIPASIKSHASGNKKQGMTYHLFVANETLGGGDS